MVELNCNICSNLFSVKKYRKDKAKYCSQKCTIVALNGYKKTSKWLTAVTKFNREKKPHLGKKHSDSVKEKLRQHNFQNPRRYWLGKENPNHRGEKNVNWKGGVTPENEKARKSIAYNEWRRKVFERDHFICRVCFSKGYVQANHIYPFRDHIELRTEISNGITLCVPCHKFVFKREYLFIRFFQGILENGLNSVEVSKEITPSQQERFRKALWACVTVSGE